jgi:hypothetical protein
MVMLYIYVTWNGRITMADNDWAELVKLYEEAERKRLDTYMLRTHPPKST